MLDFKNIMLKNSKNYPIITLPSNGRGMTNDKDCYL